MSSQRADVALVARGLFESRAKAREAIEAGLVSVDGRAIEKPSQRIEDDAQVVARRAYAWVSRGGVKLAAALDVFGVDPQGAVCLDLGSSTGGFAHVLLSRGAALVYAVDVGHGQMHPSLRSDARLHVFEGCDARRLNAALIPRAPNLITADLSFISLKLALPGPLALAASPARLIALIKPQFEAGPRDVRKGFVKDPATHARVCEEIAEFLRSCGWAPDGLVASPIAGGDGAREFLICARRE